MGLREGKKDALNLALKIIIHSFVTTCMSGEKRLIFGNFISDISS